MFNSCEASCDFILSNSVRRYSTKLWSLFALALFSVTLLSVPVLASDAIACQAAGTTGLTALMVATPGETISGQTIDASGAGCDVGIYVGPGVNGVTITGNTITGANDHGIFVQDANSITIKDNHVTGNGNSPHTFCSPPSIVTNCISEDKAIELVGTSNSVVSGNIVNGNNADGGIGIADDGPLDPGAPASTATSATPGANNVVSGNYVKFDRSGCGIVVAAYNPGGGVSGNTVKDNTVIGNSVTDAVIQGFVGGIVVAADTPSTTATNNKVLDNTINGSLIPGVVVHSNAPGDIVSGTIVQGITISYNGVETTNNNEPHAPTGIMVVAEIPGLTTITGTIVSSNTVNNNVYSVWYCNTNPTISNQMGSVTLVGTCQTQPQPPSGVPEFPLGSIGFAAVLGLCLMLLLFIRKRHLSIPHVPGTITNSW